MSSAQPAQTRRTVRVGTRGSRLARWQAQWVCDQIRAHRPGLEVDILEINTQGDRDRNSPLAKIGGSGVFTKEIQRALLAETIDVAVHSLKDMPTQGPPGLTLAAVPARDAMADALVAPRARTLDALPPAARVGTSSLRRQAQLLNIRPDLQVVSVRGNVETRLNQAIDGRLEAVVLAEAGLVRLHLEHHVTQRLGPPAFLPAVGQGALGIECRSDDETTHALLVLLEDPAARRAVVAERRVLAELEGGCMIPLAAWARDTADGLALDVHVFSLDGRDKLTASAIDPKDDPDRLGCQVAQLLRNLGVERLLRPLGRP